MSTEQELPHAFVCFRDVSWLSFYGGVRMDNALDYFSLSQFYDRTCTNEVLRMQMRNPDGSLPMQAAVTAHLPSLTGIEFVILEDQCKPSRLYIVAKRERTISLQPPIIRECYYILDGSVYMAPTLNAVLMARLTGAIGYLDIALKSIKRNLEFDPKSGQYTSKSDNNDLENVAFDIVHAEEDAVFDSILKSL